MLCEDDDRQQLSPSDAVVHLGRLKNPSGIGDNAFLAILNLGQHRPYRPIAGIGV
jgi:hypothetical protein